MLTVGRLARRFGLSRSTLLYYDKVGLLSPSGRSSANYRLYTDGDTSRLASICQLRETGLSLDEIREVLEAPGDRTTSILELHLEGLNERIAKLRAQQRIVIELLRSRESWKQARTLDKEGWVAILAATGLDEAGMQRWHEEFERLSPEGHQDFLESLGIPLGEVRHIRRWSQQSS
jgi:MerR family transcriptional regulator, thiopeptide resistance regulator